MMSKLSGPPPAATPGSVIAGFAGATRAAISHVSPGLRATARLVGFCLLGLVSLDAQLVLAAVVDRVHTNAGIVEGAGAQPSGVRVFRGIPFAEAPVGPLRWRAPVAKKRWLGVRKADRFGARCFQAPVFGDMNFRSNSMSEDCLYLNVWTPARSAHERLPVMVYFYGGGFVAGDGSEPRYDGESMARHGIVAVTLNYRLGVFGFLAHPELSRETAYHGSGNYGLLDQVAALRWVHDNIAAFGGDPARVTIAGESAGSISVSALMASPLSRDLIAGAIGESGSILGALPAEPLAAGEATGEQFAGKAGATSLADLRALPAERLLADNVKLGAFAFASTVDGYLFPKPPEAIYAAGEQAHVPLLAGSNSEEMPAALVLGPDPATLAGYRTALTRLYAADAPALLKLYPAAADGVPVLDAAQALASDRFIAVSTWKWMAEATATGGRHTYYYYYAHKRPPLRPEFGAGTEGLAGGVVKGDPATPPRAPTRGAVHASEIEYALGNLDVKPMYSWTSQDYEVSRVMQAYFVQFIKSGDPNTAGLPPWPSYASGQRMVLDVLSHARPDWEAARGKSLDELASRKKSLP